MDAGAGVDALQPRGRDPLARPLRDHAGARGARSRDAAADDSGACHSPPPRPGRQEPADERRPVRHPAPGQPALEIIDVSRIHGRGDAAVHALRGLHLTRAARRDGRGDGPLGLGQVDPAQPRRRPRPGHRRPGAGAGPRARLAVQGQPRAGTPTHGRLRLPGLQPDPQPDRRARTSRCRSSSTGSRRGAPPSWPARRSRRSGSAVSTTASPTTCRAVSSSGSPSPARSWGSAA